jgi:hypothetical protein
VLPWVTHSAEPSLDSRGKDIAEIVSSDTVPCRLGCRGGRLRLPGGPRVRDRRIDLA